MSRTGRSSAAQPPAKTRYKVALIADKPNVRRSWRRLVDSFPDFRCVCACASGLEALRLIPSSAPDVVLISFLSPQAPGIEYTTRLRNLLPQVPILVLTRNQNSPDLFPALEAGANGFLLARTDPSDLHLALLEVLSGGAPMPRGIARRVVASFRKKANSGTHSASLTAREEETLVLLTRGCSNKEIADQLGLGIETVRSHLKHLYEKMQVHSRTDAVAHYLSAKVASARSEGG